MHVFDARVLTSDGFSDRLLLSGEFDELAVPRFDAAADTLDTAQPIIVDLRDLSFIDSSGLRCLLNLAQRVEWGGGTIRLEHADERTRRLLAIAGVGARLEIAD